MLMFSTLLAVMVAISIKLKKLATEKQLALTNLGSNSEISSILALVKLTK